MRNLYVYMEKIDWCQIVLLLKWSLEVAYTWATGIGPYIYHN